MEDIIAYRFNEQYLSIMSMLPDEMIKEVLYYVKTAGRLNKYFYSRYYKKPTFILRAIDYAVKEHCNKVLVINAQRLYILIFGSENSASERLSSDIYVQITGTLPNIFLVN